MAQYSIIDSRKVPSLIPARRGSWDRLITYMVDGKRESARAVLVPNADPTQGDIDAAIRADFSKDSTYIGRTGTL